MIHEPVYVVDRHKHVINLRCVCEKPRVDYKEGLLPAYYVAKSSIRIGAPRLVGEIKYRLCLLKLS